MVQEANLVRTENGLEPEGEGWYVVNAREARWYENDEFGSWVNFEGDVRFAQVGFNIAVLAPGQPACMYHGEEDQEAFLVLAGRGRCCWSRARSGRCGSGTSSTVRPRRST